jgi:hypothetical protein
MKRALLVIGLLILFAGEILRVYFIMPFPGSQQKNTIALAYWIGNNIIWIRILALALISFQLVNIFKSKRSRPKIALGAVLAVYAVIFFFFNYRFEADKMFYQPKQRVFVDASADTTNKNELVIGVSVNGEAKAYPIRIIGYHHQVMDTIDHTPVMVTYCTVCRTGRVFSPFINGKKASFRLVGMDHFNAMFEDAETGTWWRQATGKAIAGPMKGAAIKEIASKQLTLAAWLREYPNSSVMQPDTSFKKDYADLKGYDNGTIKGGLERRDSASWKRKSWVIGVVNKRTSKAYDWNELVKNKVINDAIAGLPVVLAIEEDKASFHVYNSIVKGAPLHFETGTNGALVDEKTHSTWNMDGVCIDGTMKGEKLNPVQSYQEFWHSWSTFHPNTLKYSNNGPLNQVKI